MATRHQRPPTHPVRLIWRALPICESRGLELFQHPGPVEEMSVRDVERVFEWARDATKLNQEWLATIRDTFFFQL